MDEPIEVVQVGRLRVELHYDETPVNPRDPRYADNAGTMVFFHGRYDLVNESGYRKEDYNSWGELQQAILEDNPGAIVLPVWMYEHGSVALKVGSFQGSLPQGHAEFDSGQIGFIYISRETIKHEWGDGPDADEKAEAYLRGEVAEYGAYLEGDVFGWVLKDENDDVVDSCWGYVGDRDYAWGEAVGAAEYIKAEDEQAERKVADDRNITAIG